MKFIRNSITFVLALLSWQLQAQNLDKIGSKEMVKVSGGVSFNSIAYAQNGLVLPSREPFTWFASGNVTVNLLDVALPFTFTYSNQGGRFTQPLNRTALHPTYKWVKSHIGVVSMNFSPYTLTGHLFLGGGVELTPGNWKIQAMAGRLNKAVEYDPLENNLNEMVYQRFGYGLKAGYEQKGYGGAITIFKAADNPTSLQTIPLNSSVKPQDNLVMSAEGKANITAQLNVTAEYALSLLTQNRLAINESNSPQTLARLVNGNETTAFFQAYNAALNYNLKKMKVAFKFEHIDPGYKTLGGYYFNNDLENYTVAPSFSLFKKKLNIGINTGFQKNNLSSQESATTSRWIGSINGTYVPSKQLVLTGTYSNFSTFTQSRPIGDPFYFNAADTLNFYQLTQSASSMVSYNFGTDSLKNVMQFLYNYQESTSLNGAISQAGAFGVNVNAEVSGVPTRIHLFNLAYTLQIARIKGAVSLASNVNRTILPDYVTTFFGPTLNFQKSIFNQKATMSIGSTYNRQTANSELAANVMNHRMSLNYTPKQNKEAFGQFGCSANINLMQRLQLIQIW